MGGGWIGRWMAGCGESPHLFFSELSPGMTCADLCFPGSACSPITFFLLCSGCPGAFLASEAQPQLLRAEQSGQAAADLAGVSLGTGSGPLSPGCQALSLAPDPLHPGWSGADLAAVPCAEPGLESAPSSRGFCLSRHHLEAGSRLSRAEHGPQPSLGVWAAATDPRAAGGSAPVP